MNRYSTDRFYSVSTEVHGLGATNTHRFAPRISRLTVIFQSEAVILAATDSAQLARRDTVTKLATRRFSFGSLRGHNLGVTTRATLSLLALTSSALLVPASAASASGLEPASTIADADPEESRIVGGKPVGSCQWPAAGQVTLESGARCTASLIHPEIIVTAAHCTMGGSGMSVWFTDSIWNPTPKRYEISYCKDHPDYVDDSSLGKHLDFSFCKLRRPVTGVQVTPVMMGCELEYLQPGAEVHIVGFGEAQGSNGSAEQNTSTYGTKRHVQTSFVKFREDLGNEAEIGLNDGKGGCHGDSGGPVYAKLPEDKFGADAGWRVFGVMSGGDVSCPGRSRVGVMSNFVEFIEKESGIDVTPCTNGKGEWMPSSGCKEAPLNPFAASGDWQKGCASAPVGGYIQSCGAPYDPEKGDPSESGKSQPEADTEPPSVVVESPQHNERFTGGETVKVVVSADDDVGVASVELELDGKNRPALSQPPFEWSLRDLSKGRHTVSALVVDKAGNSARSELVSFHVESGSGAESETTGPGADSSGPKDMPEQPEDDSVGKGPAGAGNNETGGSAGLSCTTGGGNLHGVGFLVLGVLLSGFRRRSGTSK